MIRDHAHAILLLLPILRRMNIYGRELLHPFTDPLVGCVILPMNLLLSQVLSSMDAVAVRFIAAINPSSVSFRLPEFSQNGLNSGIKRT